MNKPDFDKLGQLYNDDYRPSVQARVLGMHAVTKHQFRHPSTWVHPRLENSQSVTKRLWLRGAQYFPFPAR